MVAVGPVPFPEPDPARADGRAGGSAGVPVVCATLGGLGATSLDDAPLEVLERSLKLGWAEQNAHLARWLAVLAVFDRREGWAGWGVRSCAHWLSIHCGISTITGAEQVRIARQLETLPKVAAAMARGELSYSKVRAIAPVATPDNEHELVALAAEVSASQLGSVARLLERQRQGDTISEDEKEMRRSVQAFVDDDGMGHLEVICHPDELEVIKRGIDFGREQLYQARKTEPRASDGPGPGRVAAPSRVDSLLWTIRAGLDRLDADPGYAPPSPYLVMIHAKEASAFVDDKGLVQLGGGFRMHPRRLQQLACDATVRLLLHGRDDQEGSPLDVGRGKRTITDRQRAALLAVYDTCDFDGCCVPARFCEWHHIEFWTNGGATNRANLRPVCHTHHRLAHAPGVRVVIGPANYLIALRLTEPDGHGCAVSAGGGGLVDELHPNGLVACNLAAGVHTNDPDALTARWGGAPLTPFATSVILEHLTPPPPTHPDRGGGCTPTLRVCDNPPDATPTPDETRSTSATPPDSERERIVDRGARRARRRRRR